MALEQQSSGEQKEADKIWEALQSPGTDSELCLGLTNTKLIAAFEIALSATVQCRQTSGENAKKAGENGLLLFPVCLAGGLCSLKFPITSSQGQEVHERSQAGSWCGVKV